MLRFVFTTLVFALVALALVVYVYPRHPFVVWSLLGVSWACYRLSLRAQKQFGAAAARAHTASTTAAQL